MSYNQLPPPPPDRVGMQPGGPYGGPQLAGPGGAYGPIEHSPGQPIPGQLPPPEMTMAKPRSILGIQVILWTLAAVAAIGDLFSMVNAVEFGDPLALIGLAFAVYSTIQSIITPVHITRGKRWAWVWALVSAILGLAIAAFAIVFGLSVIEMTPVPVLIGAVLGGLYGTLTVLLASKSAREWILMHRIERGEIESIGVPRAGAQGVLVTIAPERPERKPGSVTFVQLALWTIALLPLVWIWFGLRWAQVAFENGLESWDRASNPFDHFMDSDLMLLGVLGAAGFAVLATLAIISAVGLERGRFWARVFTPVWVGLVALAGVPWVIAMSALSIDFEGESDELHALFPATLIVAAAGSLVVVLSITSFIMVFLRGVRSWAPGMQTVISYEPATQGRPLPGQPPTAAVPPGHPAQGPAPQWGYQAPQGYPQQPHRPGAPPQFGGPQGFAPPQAPGQQQPFPQQAPFPQQPHQPPTGPYGQQPPR